MGQKLEKPAELTEDEIEKYNNYNKVCKSKYSMFIEYNHSKKVYEAKYYIYQSSGFSVRRPLGYYKTIEEAETRIENIFDRIFGKVENEELLINNIN